jgi:hypothetical protein
VTRELWPVIDAVLQRRLRRVGDDVRKSLAVEVDRIAAQVRTMKYPCCSWPATVLVQHPPLSHSCQATCITSARDLRPQNVHQSSDLMACSCQDLTHDWKGCQTVFQHVLQTSHTTQCTYGQTAALILQGLPTAGGQSGWGKLMASFQSADDMLDEVNFCVGCLAPLGGPRIAAALRKVHLICNRLRSAAQSSAV